MKKKGLAKKKFDKNLKNLEKARDIVVDVVDVVVLMLMVVSTANLSTKIAMEILYQALFRELKEWKKKIGSWTGPRLAKGQSWTLRTWVRTQTGPQGPGPGPDKGGPGPKYKVQVQLVSGPDLVVSSPIKTI